MASITTVQQLSAESVINSKGAERAGSSVIAVQEIEQRCRELAATRPENTQKIASDLLGMGKAYYHDACMRAQQSFKVALGAAVVGTLFFFASSVLVMTGRTDRATFTTVGGA